MASHRVSAGLFADLLPFLFIIVFTLIPVFQALPDPSVPPVPWVQEKPHELPVQTVIAAAQTDEQAPCAGQTVYSSVELESMGVTTLEEAIALAPSLALSPIGASGAQSTITIRGSTSNQVLVLIDGVRVSDPATGLVDLARISIPVSDITTIEVIRGGLTALYGADAVGGVVLVTTRRGSDKPEILLQVSNHSFLPAASVAGSGAAAVAVPASLFSLGDGQSLLFKAHLPGGVGFTASAERATNAYLYYDSNFIRRRRLNADLVRGSARVSWKGFLGEGIASAGLEFGARSLGLPGTLDVPSPQARQRDLDASIAADYSTDYFGSDAISYDATVFGKFGVLEYRESPDETADLHRNLRAGGDSRWSILLGDSSSVKTGFSLRYDGLYSTLVKDGSGTAPQRASVGVFIAPALVLGSWSLQPAARWDWTNDFPSGLSFSIGAGKSLNEMVLLSFSASTAYRAPSFDDLYWPLANGAEGNPDLGPDLAYSAEAGLSAKREGWTVSSSVFVRYVRDVILWQENDDGIWRPTNFGDAFYPGLELEYMSTSPPWALHVSYSFINSYVLSGGLSMSDDKRVPGVPVQRLAATGSYSSGPFKASLSGTYEGLRYLTTANLLFQPATFLLGVRLEWSLDRRSSLFIKGENLLNERYESTKGYPMPGFSFELGLEYKLGSDKGSNHETN